MKPASFDYLRSESVEEALAALAHHGEAARVLAGGEVVLRSARARRTVAAERFFTGILSTACRADELIEEVRFPLRRQGAGEAFRELGLRHGDFAICAIAVVAEGERLRIGVGGVADRPVVRDLSALANDALDAALNQLARDLDAADAAHATPRYPPPLRRP